MKFLPIFKQSMVSESRLGNIKRCSFYLEVEDNPVYSLTWKIQQPPSISFIDAEVIVNHTIQIGYRHFFVYEFNYEEFLIRAAKNPEEWNIKSQIQIIYTDVIGNKYSQIFYVSESLGIEVGHIKLIATNEM